MKQEQTTTSRAGAQKSWVNPDTLARFQEQVADSAKDAYDAVVDYSADALTKANRRASSIIRHYPVQAAAGALAVGFLFGAMMARRRE